MLSVSVVCVNHTIFAIENTEYKDDVVESGIATILSEDISKREEGSKTFIMSDKSMQKILYSVPVHYYEDGIWKEIDNTLVESNIEVQNEAEMQIDTETQEELQDNNDVIIQDEDINVSLEEMEDMSEESIEEINESENILEAVSNEMIEGYETKNSKFKVKFAKKVHKKNMVSISIGDYKISWGIDEFDNKSKAKITTNNNANNDQRLQVFNKIYQNVLYEDVFDDVSIEYVFDSNMIKENIVLEKSSDVHAFTFNYKTENLVLSLEEDGSMVAKDASTNEVVFNMPKPFMVDANNEYCYDVSYVIEKAKNNQYVIRVEANEEWLNAKDRAYPIVIDPVISTNQNINDIDTTFVTSAQPTYNHCNKLELLVGNESSVYGSCRILVKFDLPTLNRGDMVVDAQLNMALYNKGFYSSGTPDMEVDAHIATSYWHVEQVTWNTKPGYESTIQDYDFVKHADVNGSTNWKSWNITNAVKRWYEGELENEGIVLKPRVETSDYANYGVKGAFWPERYNSTTQAYPYIAINYRNNKGIESYWDYTTANSNYGDMIAINNYSGNPIITHEDASTHSQILPVTLSHVYNGYQAGVNVNYVGPYVGKGWRLSIQQTLKSSSLYGLSGSSLTNYPYVYTDEDGTEHYFMKTSEGLVDEDGVGLKLTVNESSYVMKDKANNTLTFNANGNLVEVKNEQGSKISIEYSGTTITRIIDMDNQILTLTTGADGYLSSVTDSAGRTTTFTYTNGLLIGITDSYGKITSYSYDGDNSIIQTTFPDMNAYSLQYTSLAKGKRVNKLQELDGKTVLVNRTQHNVTTITTAGVDCTINTADDIKTDLTFDDYGRLISRSSYNASKYLGTSNFVLSQGESSGDSNTKDNNKLLYSGYASPSVFNMAINHSLESTTNWYHSSSVGSATYTFSNTNEESLFGQKSFKLNVTAIGNKGRARFYQELKTTYIKPNTTYTASAYIKTKDVEVTQGAQGGAVLLVYINAPSMPINTNPAAADFVSEYIVGTTDEEINDGWRRVSVTFTTPSDISYIRINGMVKEATGIAYFDGIQLEEGNVCNPYNMVIGSSFEMSTGDWYGIQLSSADIRSTAVKKTGAYSFKVSGNVSANKRVYQTINVKGKEEDTYVLSLWVYGKGSSKGALYMEPTITYSDGSTKTKEPLECNPNIKGWQYKSYVFNLDDGASTNKTPTSIKIMFRSANQANDVYFDDVQLIRKDAIVYKYDVDGNIISDGYKTYAYSDNKLVNVTDSLGMTHTYAYDENGNLSRIENNKNELINIYQYDMYGRPISTLFESPMSSIITEKQYTSTDTEYITKNIDEDGKETQSNVEKITGQIQSSTNENTDITQYLYNNKDLLEKINFIDSSTDMILKTLEYTYDQNDRMIALSNGNTVYNYGYDTYGNLTSISIGNTSLLSIEYNQNNGSVRNETISDDCTYTYIYDEYGNIRQKQVNSLTCIEYVYNSEGTLLEMIDHQTNIHVKLDYDFSGNIIALDYYTYVPEDPMHYLMNNWLYGIEYGYDKEGRITKYVVYVDGQSFAHSYEYREDGLLLNYSIDEQTDMSYSYDSLTRLEGKTIHTENEIDVNYEYKDSERGETFTTGKISKEGHGQYRFAYEYDDKGNIVLITRMVSTSFYASGYSDSRYFEYEYDDQSRLVSETYPFARMKSVYEYNESGDILSETVYALYDDMVLDRKVYTYTDSVWGNVLTSYDGEEITYDTIGNPLSYKGYTMTWSGKELDTISKDEKTCYYIYDASGNRVSKQILNTNTDEIEYYSMTYINDKLVKETCEYGTLYYTYDNFDNLIKIKHITAENVENEYIVITNTGGDVDSIYSDTGELLASYVYDAWGNVMHIENPIGEYITDESHIANINPIRYKGYYYDKETGLYFLNSRYYDPQTHRFINADDASVTLMDTSSLYNKNLYAYCDNNPLIREDENGNFAGYTLAKVGVSVAINVVASLILAEKTGTIDKYGIDDLMNAVVIGALGGGDLNWIILGFTTGYLSYKLAVSNGLEGREALLDGVSSGIGESISVMFINKRNNKNLNPWLEATIGSIISTTSSLSIVNMDSKTLTYSYVAQISNPSSNIGISTYNNGSTHNSSTIQSSTRPTGMFK